MSLLARLIAAGTPPDLVAEVAKLDARMAILAEKEEARKAKDRARKPRKSGNSTETMEIQSVHGNQPPSEPLPSSLLPSEEKKEVRSLRSLTVRAEIDADFEAMWKVYPRRPGNPKEPARKAYHKQRAEGATAEEIHRGAMLLAKAMVGQDPRYIPHTTTWLNQKRYRDDPTPLPTPSKPNVLFEACDAVIDAAEDADRRARYGDGEAGQVLDWPVQRLTGFR